eukprot:TRINITY_DN25610_c0_g1_i1.p1 TRINITY_DN25610_c0_g1~~TRINITY_DN25610_c0_g1_i1.p1  ORF type:complete len:223 (-),score=11.01 TRINITY_DN25610_c0_g1_i1:143-811(-)
MCLQLRLFCKVLIYLNLLKIVSSEDYLQPDDWIDLYPGVELTHRIKLDNSTIHYKLNNLKINSKYEVRLSYVGTMRLHVNFEQNRQSQQFLLENKIRSVRKLLMKADIPEKCYRPTAEKQHHTHQIETIKKNCVVNELQNRAIAWHPSLHLYNAQKQLNQGKNYLDQSRDDVFQSQEKYFKWRKLLDLEKTFVEVDDEKTIIIVGIRVKLTNKFRVCRNLGI